MREVIITGFEGDNNSSKLIVKGLKTDCRKLILPNDREKAAELLKKEIGSKFTVCVIMLGQRPRISGKIAVEPKARRCGEVLSTKMSVASVKQLLKEGGMEAYYSRGCGSENSYCNSLYYDCLETGVNCIFLHVPTKDNCDIKTAAKAVENLLDNLATVPALLTL